MNGNYKSEAVDRLIELKLRAVDRYVEECVSGLADFGNPETLLGKPFEEWTPYDRQLVDFFYADDERYKMWLVKKDLERVQALEAEEV